VTRGTGLQLIVRLGSRASAAGQKVTMTAHSRPSQFKPPTRELKAINLALQGGGFHGAFTWGVLDRLLEQEQLLVEGISATSAGSVNAVVLAYGLSVAGREGAKRALEIFWRRLSAMMTSSFVQPSIFDKSLGNFGLEFSAGYVMTKMLCQFLSPYQLNPFNLNPLKDLLEEVVDFARVRELTAVKLFLCATNVRKCSVEIFQASELTVDHVLASSCLPLFMQAVEIDGERYWDGGFVGNPALFPLIYECDAHDIVMVQVTPVRRPDFPVTAHSILRRMQEVSVSSSLVREMRAVAFVNHFLDQGRMTGGKKIFVHSIDADDILSDLPNSSKLNGDWDFLSYLHDLGRKYTENWLSSTFDRLGTESSVDLTTKYL
jgi:NTE family protein